MATNRVVLPELLDVLPPDDPEAVRSRRDLRLINGLMGNTPWIARQIARHPEAAALGLVELGAGEGMLSRALHRRFPDLSLTGLDRIPRPPDLPGEINWLSGDFFDSLPPEGGIVLGTMIVHHFQPEGLAALGKLLAGHRMIILCEPLRSRFAHFLGLLLRPIVGKVTRHDMHVSIDAGFRPGELTGLLGLKKWRVTESADIRGTLRYVAINE